MQDEDERKSLSFKEKLILAKDIIISLSIIFALLGGVFGWYYKTLKAESDVVHTTESLQQLVVELDYLKESLPKDYVPRLELNNRLEDIAEAVRANTQVTRDVSQRVDQLIRWTNERNN